MPFRIKTYAHSNRNQNQVQIEPKLIRIKVCAHSNQTYAHHNQTYAHQNQSLHPFKSEKSTLLSPSNLTSTNLNLLTLTLTLTKPSNLGLRPAGCPEMSDPFTRVCRQTRFVDYKVR